mgnify:CR=1 FL=1
MNYGDKEVVFYEESDVQEEKEEVVITAAEYVVLMLENDEIAFRNPTYQKIFNHYSGLVHNDKPIEVRSLMLNTDVDIVETVVTLSAQKYELSENWKLKHKIYVSTEDMKLKFALEHSVLAFQLNKVELSIQEIQNKLKSSDIEGDVTELLSSQLTFIELKKMISDKLNRVILK